MKLLIVILLCIYAVCALPIFLPAITYNNANLQVDAPVGNPISLVPGPFGLRNMYTNAVQLMYTPGEVNLQIPTRSEGYGPINGYIEFNVNGLTSGNTYNLMLDAYLFAYTGGSVPGVTDPYAGSTVTVSWNGLVAKTHVNLGYPYFTNSLFNSTIGSSTQPVVATGNDVVRVTLVDPVGNQLYRFHTIFGIHIW